MVPVRCLWFLKHAPSGTTRPLGRGEAAARILEAAFLQLFGAEQIVRGLDAASALCKSVPCYELAFVPDRSAVEFLRKHAPLEDAVWAGA